tara:strand:- start:98 stop:655 length:558 start_codon:yes stop_codon:yes gene_type:complete
MIKLTHLLTEIVTESEFDKAIKQAKKETGAKDMIPNKTIKLCKDVGKLKINKYDYKGKKGKKRDVNGLMYQYYAYIQGWGHTKFKGAAGWFLDGRDFDPILRWIYENGKHKLMDYSYMRWHVTSDLQASQIVANLSPGDKDVEPGYYLAKDYYNSFGADRNRNVVFDYCVAKVTAWMEDNKIETL